MRALLIIIAIVVILAAAVVVPVMIAPAPRELSSTPALLHGLGRVPAGATEVFLVPSFGSTYRMLRHNRLTAEAFASVAGESGSLPFLVGNADVVFWRTAAGSQAGSFEAGPFRRLLISTFRGFASEASRIEVAGNVVYFGGRDAAGSGAAPDPLTITKLSRGAAGHLFMLQLPTAGGSFLKLSRPSLTSVLVEPSGVRVLARGIAASGSTVAIAPPIALPSNAIFSAAVSSPPKLVRTIDRILPLKISPLLDRGGVISIYKVEIGRLVPKIEGALQAPGAYRVSQIEQAVAASEKSFRIGGFDFSRESSRTVGGVKIRRSEMLGAKVEYATRGDELLLSFDRKSIEKILTAEPALRPGAGTSQLIRFVPKEVDSILAKAIEHPAFGFLNAEERASLQNAQMWIHRVRSAGVITAEWKRDGDLDEVSIGLVGTK